jgi:hypothetical protein
MGLQAKVFFSCWGSGVLVGDFQDMQGRNNCNSLRDHYSAVASDGPSDSSKGRGCGKKSMEIFSVIAVLRNSVSLGKCDCVSQFSVGVTKYLRETT